MKLTTIYYGSDIIRYTVQTFGCKVNQYESASVAKAMDEHGYEKTDDIFTADIVIINSCSVTENSDKKAKQLINRIKSSDPMKIVVLTGCFPQAFPETASKLSADIVTGTEHKDSIADMIDVFTAVEINFQEFIMNSSVNTAKLRNILISNNKEIPRDILDDYNKNLETYIAKSEDATSEKITLVAMSYTPNETVDNVNIMFRYYREMQNFYAAIGSETRQLMPEEVFAILYEYYHPFDNTEFLLPSDIYSRGGSIKDYIAPSMFAFRPKEVEIGNSYTRILYMARYDRTLDDEFIRDILDNNCKIVVSKHIKHIDKSEAQDRVKDNIYAHQGKIQARLEKNHKKD